MIFDDLSRDEYQCYSCQQCEWSTEDTQGHWCELLSSKPILAGQEKQQLDKNHSYQRKKKSHGNLKEQHRRRRQRRRQQNINNVISDNASHTNRSLLIVTEADDNDFNDENVQTNVVQ